MLAVQLDWRRCQMMCSIVLLLGAQRWDAAGEQEEGWAWGL
jgi:hypothetical protein